MASLTWVTGSESITGGKAMPPKRPRRWSMHAFTISKVQSLPSGYHKDNPASGRVLSKLGFRIVGKKMRRIGRQRRHGRYLAAPLDPGRLARRPGGGVKFLDQAKVYIRSGDGGAGSCRFRREKFIEFGGPTAATAAAAAMSGRGGRRPQHADRLPLPAAFQGQDRRATAWAATAPAPRAPTWC